MNIETLSYAHWPNCLRLSNENVELIATTDVGPRLIRWGFLGGENVFKEFSEQLGRTGGDEWRSYGGHRLWLAPEDEPRSYYPDNNPVEVSRHGEHSEIVTLTSPVETTTSMQKELVVSLHPSEARATILHRVTNKGIWPVELAPWALSVMAPGGVCVFPLPERGTHPEQLLPTSTLSLWPFTDMSDPRWTWGRKYIMLRQDERNSLPQKIGALVTDGWACYARNGTLFAKTFAGVPDEFYADLGCNFETFTNEEMLEVETLGPLQILEPGETIEHVEEWALFKDVPTPQNDDDVDRDIMPLVR